MAADSKNKNGIASNVEPQHGCFPSKPLKKRAQETISLLHLPLQELVGVHSDEGNCRFVLLDRNGSRAMPLSNIVVVQVLQEPPAKAIHVSPMPLTLPQTATTRCRLIGVATEDMTVLPQMRKWRSQLGKCRLPFP